MNDRWHNCKVALHQRVGDVMWDKLSGEHATSPTRTSAVISHTHAMLSDMMAFMEYCAKVAAASKQ
eukprot:7400455-Pyramimonas_sp.AAC.1